MALVTDASPPPKSPTKQKRKKSYLFEEEDIIVKPSTELIPDEYEHSSSDTILFHIFSTPTSKYLAEDLLKCVQNIEYVVDGTKNLHELNRHSELKTDLETIRNEAKNKNALILFFIGNYGKEDGTLQMLEETEFPKSVHIREVWNFFSSNNCPELKHKPKIFVFCTSSGTIKIQTDSMPHHNMQFDKIYDFPAESDMLIVYQKVEVVTLLCETRQILHSKNVLKEAKVSSVSFRKNFNVQTFYNLFYVDPWFLEVFLDQICYNVTNYSKKYDVIDLISYFHTKSTVVPLLVSTLTRKFYLTPNSEREHYLTVIENHTYLEETLQKIQEDIQKIHDAQKKKKEKKFFSFKKKSEEKPKVVKRKDKEKTIMETPRVSARMDSPNSPKSPSFSRTSTTSAPGRRSRQSSVTDTSSVKRKPIWKI